MVTGMKTLTIEAVWNKLGHQYGKINEEDKKNIWKYVADYEKLNVGTISWVILTLIDPHIDFINLLLAIVKSPWQRYFSSNSVYTWLFLFTATNIPWKWWNTIFPSSATYFQYCSIQVPIKSSSTVYIIVAWNLSFLSQ